MEPSMKAQLEELKDADMSVGRKLQQTMAILAKDGRIRKGIGGRELWERNWWKGTVGKELEARNCGKGTGGRELWEGNWKGNWWKGTLGREL